LLNYNINDNASDSDFEYDTDQSFKHTANYSVDGVAETMKEQIRNDIKVAEAKLDSPSFSKYSKDSFFAQ